MVIFALSIVGLVALLALVVDGGNIYVQRRTAVTAADAGALAGTRALKNATASSDVAAIRTDLTTFVQANGFGTQAGTPCAYFVDTAGNPIAGGGIVNAGTVAGCPALTGLIPNGASGVHVDSHIRFNTFLAGMLRVSVLDADAHATGQVGVLTTYNAGNVPLIACGGGSGAALRVTTAPNNGVTAKSGNRYYATLTNRTLDPVTPPLPTFTISGSGSGGAGDQILLANGEKDPAKEGYLYYLKGSGIGAFGSKCGINSSTFDGGAEPGQSLVTVPSTLEGSNGNDVSGIGEQVAMPGGCRAGTDILTFIKGDPGCVLVLPIADGSTSSNPPILTIRTWGAFYVWCNAGSSSGTGCQEFVGTDPELVDLRQSGWHYRRPPDAVERRVAPVRQPRWPD